MPTLTRLLSSLAEKYDTSKRPSRYFDVRKRGELSAAEVRYVKNALKSLLTEKLASIGILQIHRVMKK